MNALLALAFLAAPAQPLDQLVGHLAAHQCDEAFLLLSRVQVPGSPTRPGTTAAKAVVRGAAECGKEDPRVGLSLLELAARLDPGDVEIQVALAEALVALDEPRDAAAVLDAVIAKHPAKQAPQAHFLRATLALEAGQTTRAEGLLTPLLAEPAWAERAAKKLALARSQQVRRQAEPATSEPAPSLPSAPQHASGTVVQAFPGVAVGLGGSATLEVRGLVPGHVYLLRSNGVCEREPKPYPVDEFGNLGEKPNLTPIFGIDLRVQFGNQPSRSLAVGQLRSEVNRIDFVAQGAEMVVRVFDDSSVDRDVRCTVQDFAVVAP